MFSSFKNKLQTHGNEVLVQGVLGESTHTTLSMYDVNTVICMVEAASLCLGVSVEEECGSRDDVLQKPVAGSRSIEISVGNFKESKLVSESCSLLVFGVSACRSSSYVRRL